MTKKQLETNIKQLAEDIRNEIDNLDHDVRYYDQLKMASRVAYTRGYQYALKCTLNRLCAMDKEEL